MVANAHVIELAPEQALPALNTGSIFFVGTATVILRFAGFVILTDPNFLHKGDHIHVGYGLQAVRQTDPAIVLAELPHIDFVLLSHLHEDHFDQLVAANLPKTTPIITNPQAAKTLQGLGFSAVQAINTWETITFSKGEATLRVTALPAVMGSMLTFENSKETPFYVYVSGDTLIHNALREIPRRFPNVDLALLHLGGARLLGVMLTMDGKQGVEAMKIIAPRLAIPIHFDDYDNYKSPLEDFVQAVREAGLEEKVMYLKRGDTYKFTAHGQGRK